MHASCLLSCFFCSFFFFFSFHLFVCFVQVEPKIVVGWRKGQINRKHHQTNKRMWIFCCNLYVDTSVERSRLGSRSRVFNHVALSSTGRGFLILSLDDERWALVTWFRVQTQNPNSASEIKGLGLFNFTQFVTGIYIIK